MRIPEIEWDHMAEAEKGYGVTIISTDKDSKDLLRNIGMKEGTEINVIGAYSLF